MKTIKLTQTEMMRFVLNDEKLSEIYLSECNKAGLSYSNHLNGGCKIGKKKVGIQKFINTQKSIAQSVYFDYQN